eukprot:201851_1
MAYNHPKRSHFEWVQDTDDIKSHNITSIWKPHRLPRARDMLKSKYIIFIAPEMTESAMKDKPFEESFETARHLFYHLQCQCRLQIMDGKCKLFKSIRNGRQLILFNAELQAAHTKRSLYIVGYDNSNQHPVKWAMERFMTEHQIQDTFALHHKDLPQPSRQRLYENMRQMKEYKQDMNVYKDALNLSKIKALFRVKQIKSPQKAQRPCPLVIGRSLLLYCIKASIEHNELQPMIYFNKNIQNPCYRIQILLPIEIQNNWFGIAFDYDGKNQWNAVQMCIDDVDVRRKLCFFKPSMDIEEYKWFSNNISDISIISDDAQSKINQMNEENERLRQMIQQQDALIGTITQNWIHKRNALMQVNHAKDKLIQELKQRLLLKI